MEPSFWREPGQQALREFVSEAGRTLAEGPDGYQGEGRQLFSASARVTELERADILHHEPRFRERGLTRLEEVVWLVERHG